MLPTVVVPHFLNQRPLLDGPQDTADGDEFFPTDHGTILYRETEKSMVPSVNITSYPLISLERSKKKKLKKNGAFSR